MAKRKGIEIRIGRNFAKDMGKIVDNPKILDAEPKKVIYVDSPKILASLLSSKKIELITFLNANKEQNISSTARRLKRKQEAVSRDMHFLERLGLVELEKQGNKAIPKRIAKALTISF